MGPHRRCRRCRRPRSSYRFRGRPYDLDLRAPLAQPGMSRRDPDYSGASRGADPYGCDAADQEAGILANELCGTLELQPDRIGRKRADVAELIGDPQYQASAIRTVRQQLGIIRRERELLVESLARPIPDDDLLAADVSLDAQIGPILQEVECQLREHERRMGEVWEL